ncbi:MAG: phage portal protein, partial [Oscillospiraceae bacterium]
LPLKLLKSDNNGGVIKAYNHPLYNVLSTKPNPYLTATHFWSTVEYNRNHFGNAYVWINGAGFSTSLWILPSDEIEICIDDKGIFGKNNSLWYIYKNSKNGDVYKIPSDSILHFKTSTSFDGIKGISVRETLETTLDGNLKAQKMLNKSYENGFTGKVVLQYTGTLSPELEKEYQKRIKDFVDENNNSVIPMMLGTNLQPINTKLADNQFVELKKYSALQIASAFGIKPNQINDYEKSSFSSAEAQQLSFYVDTLLYILKQYEEEMSNKLLTDDEKRVGYYFKFNISVILRADLKTQIESLVSAVANGIYTPDEARGFLDLGSKGCDKLMCNGSNIPVEMIGIQYQKGGE